MTAKHQPDFTEIVAGMRRLVRGAFETHADLRKLRAGAAAARDQTRHKVFEILARQAHVDFRELSHDLKERREARRQQVTETLARLEAEATARADEEKRRFHAYRAEYLDAFGGDLAAQDGSTQLKFHHMVASTSEAREASCTYHGTGFWNPWIGPGADATAEIAVSATPPGIWFYPRLSVDANSCDDVAAGMTWHDVTFRRGAPDPSFAVTGVRVDLVANGVGSSVFGDTGWFHNPSHLFEHSFVQLDVYIAQQVNGAWQEWPLVSDRLFSGKGEYARELRSLLSGQIYPVNVILRKPGAGGGELLCFVHVTSSVQPIGTDGVVRLDFGATDVQGIFIGGVALLGGAV
jgi:hypothetical protein